MLIEIASILEALQYMIIQSKDILLGFGRYYVSVKPYGNKEGHKDAR